MQALLTLTKEATQLALELIGAVAALIGARAAILMGRAKLLEVKSLLVDKAAPSNREREGGSPISSQSKEGIVIMGQAFGRVTPGDLLKEEFLAEYRLSRSQLAKAIGISPNRIAEIVNNRRRITADTAVRLGLYFGNSAEFWMNLQTHYDLKTARRKLSVKDEQRIKSNRAA